MLRVSEPGNPIEDHLSYCLFPQDFAGQLPPQVHVPKKTCGHGNRVVLLRKEILAIPRCSMVLEYLPIYIYPKNGTNVGRYSIQGASGIRGQDDIAMNKSYKEV